MKIQKLSYKRILAGILAVALCFPMQTFATETEIKKQKQETQKQLDEINSKMKQIESQRNAVLSEIDSLDSELVDLMLNLELLEGDLEQKEAEMAEAQEEYDEAKAQEDAQYQAMKLRIQYIYEEGETDYLSLFLKAESFGDFLNKADFAQEIQTKDKEMLTAYQEIKAEVAELLEELELEKSDLEALQAEYEESKAATEAALAEKKAQEDDYESQLADARKKAQEYKSQIQKQNQQLQKLAEERKKKEAAAGGSGSSGGGIVVSGNSATGRSIANYALQFVGNPYVLGGTSLTNGADCSGFVQSVFKHFGISLPRTSDEQGRYGREVSYSEAQAGDIIYYGGHVAIYLGGGRIVHASTPATGIKTGNATYRTIRSVRRCY